VYFDRPVGPMRARFAEEVDWKAARIAIADSALGIFLRPRETLTCLYLILQNYANTMDTLRAFLILQVNSLKSVGRIFSSRVPLFEPLPRGEAAGSKLACGFPSYARIVLTARYVKGGGKKEKEKKKENAGESRGATRSSGPESETLDGTLVCFFCLPADERETSRGDTVAESSRAKGSEKEEIIYLLCECKTERERVEWSRVILDRTTVTRVQNIH